MKKILIFLAISIGLFFLCKPTVEKENNLWKSNIQNIEALKTNYTQFSAFIEEEYQQAKVIRDQGRDIKDEDLKLKVYQQANETLNNGIYHKLSSVLFDEEKINEIIQKYKADKSRYEENEGVIPLFEGAIEARDLSINVTQQRAYNNKQDALKALGIASAKLNSATASLEKLMNEINKRDAKKYKDDDDNIPEQLKQLKEDSAPPQYTCEYCGNSFTGSNCVSCGAGREMYDGTN
jgi:rubrerythrin